MDGDEQKFSSCHANRYKLFYLFSCTKCADFCETIYLPYSLEQVEEGPLRQAEERMDLDQ